jgi:lipoprotein-anchoring transpeptidase ErfK/SrfK
MKKDVDSLLNSRTQLSRRSLLLGSLAAASALSTPALAMESLYGDDGWGRDPALLPPPESPIDYPVEPQDVSEIPPQYHPQMVEWLGAEEPGTIVVDPQERFLYLVLDSGVSAMRYGVGVGRAGFAWSGNAVIQMKRRWPRWVPPEDMIYRDERAAKWANGMPGGPENPLGARALYLYSNGEDTLYRIHGTNEPKSIGKAMSSGCIRMLNQDIEELYLRVAIGTPVIVRDAETPDDLYTSSL